MNLKKELKNITRDVLRLVITPNVYNKIRFVITHKYYPDFISPSTFSEKVFARKLDSQSLSFSRYVDKYTVRKYVEDNSGIWQANEALREQCFAALPQKEGREEGRQECTRVSDNDLVLYREWMDE